MSEPFETPYEVGTLKFAALGDRVIIREDDFKSGYECTACNGTGKAKCGECDGAGAYPNGHKCAHCDTGTVTCSACGGKGGVLVIPDTVQRRPTTGTIVSVGEGKRNDRGELIPLVVKVGDQVMYSNFAGHVVDLAPAGQHIVLRLLHESEILCKLSGHLELRTLRGKTEIATFS